ARARALFAAETSVSRQTVEAAERQASADAAQLALAQRRSMSTWGQNLPWRNAADRGRLLVRLSSGDLALVRVTFPASAVGDETHKSLGVQRVDAGDKATSWTAATIWNPPADPTVPGRSFFALVDRARGLQPGERLLVFLPQQSVQDGAVIPVS